MLHLITLIAFVICSPYPLPAQETEKAGSAFGIEITPGFHGTDVKDYKGKIGEYEFLKDGIRPDLGINIYGTTKGSFFRLQGLYYEDEDFAVSADIDVQRILREEFSYFRMPHFLEHDPIKNLAACWCSATGVPVPAVTEYEDLDPRGEYYIKYSRLESKTTYRLPFLPGSQIYVDYRKEFRKGHRQAISLSKCSSCHAVSRDRTIDEYTEDISPGFKAKFGNAESGWITLTYNYLKRHFGETGNDPIATYDQALAPGGASVGKPVFSNRVQYDNINLPYSVAPSSEKDSHVIKAHGQLNKVATDVFASYVNTSAENMHTDNEYDLNSFIGRITNTLLPGLTVAGTFRWMEIDNDNVPVTVNEPVALAGPQVGQTYSQVYPDFDPVYNRLSALSRKVYETEFTAKYRLSKKMSLNGKFEWRSTDRDYYQVESGETTTNEYMGNIGLYYRHSGFYGRLAYTHDSTSDPFANPRAACNPSGINPTPGNTFTGIQYFQLYDMRRLTLTNLPDNKDEVTASVTWSISPSISLSGYYRYINESNDFDWDQESHMPSVSLFFSPSPKFNWTLSYLYNYQKTDSLICMSVFDG